MRTALLLIGLLALPAFASQTVWKWVDVNGVTHFSDQPVPGATKVEISTGNRDGRPAPATPTPSSVTAPVNTGPSYRSFEIVRPVNDQSFINTAGQVTVSVRLAPLLQAGHQVVLQLDGRPVEGYPRDTLRFDLKEVDRGTHTVKVQILDSLGTRLQETATVTFYVRQESIAQPPVGPNLLPKPKPQPRPQTRP